MNISSLDVRSMLPENLNHFFRYQGSLTTPPCYESILWTVFDTPITLSHNQVEHAGQDFVTDMRNKNKVPGNTVYFKCHGVISLVFCVQIRKLESTLMDMDNKTLWNDYRIAQDLNDRVVESSFLPRLGKGSV